MFKRTIPGFLLLTLPLVANAQHAFAPAAPAAMHAAPIPIAAAPVHSFAMSAMPVHAAAPVAVHPGARPVGILPAVPVHTSHTAGPSGRPVPRHTIGYPVSPRPPVRNRPIFSSPFLNGAPLPGNDLGVPGFGFDYVHYFAVHPNAGRFPRGFFMPFVGGTLFVPYPSYAYAEPTAPVEQAAATTPTESVEPEAADGPVEVAPPSAAAQRYSPPRPQPEYVFVRRDGTVFFAVAYSFSDSNLRFVTQDGLPKSVAVSTLDLGATRQFNDERGVSLLLPN